MDGKNLRHQDSRAVEITNGLWPTDSSGRIECSEQSNAKMVRPDSRSKDIFLPYHDQEE